MHVWEYRPSTVHKCCEWAQFLPPTYQMSLPDFTKPEILAKFNDFLGGKNFVDGYVYRRCS